MPGGGSYVVHLDKALHRSAFLPPGIINGYRQIVAQPDRILPSNLRSRGEAVFLMASCYEH